MHWEGKETFPLLDVLPSFKPNVDGNGDGVGCGIRKADEGDEDTPGKYPPATAPVPRSYAGIGPSTTEDDDDVEDDVAGFIIRIAAV
jgi:hypothetical protein